MRFAQPLPAGTPVPKSRAEKPPHRVRIILADGRNARVTRGAVEAIEADSQRLGNKLAAGQ